MKKSIIYNLSTLLNIIVLMGVFLNLPLFKNLILAKILLIACGCNIAILIIYRIVEVIHDKYSN